MNPGIFLIQDNEELVERNEQAYDSEKLLQSWLAKDAALLVGNQIDAKDPRRNSKARLTTSFTNCMNAGLIHTSGIECLCKGSFWTPPSRTL